MKTNTRRARGVPAGANAKIYGLWPHMAIPITKEVTPPGRWIQLFCGMAAVGGKSGHEADAAPSTDGPQRI